MLLFLRLIIPPADAGGIVKIAFLRDLSFFDFNYPTPWRGWGGIKIACPLGLSFFALNQPAPDGADKINIPRCRGRDSKDCFSAGASFLRLIIPGLTARDR